MGSYFAQGVPDSAVRQDTMSSYSTSSSSSCQQTLARFARTNAVDDTSMSARGSTAAPDPDGHAELADQVPAPGLVVLQRLPDLADVQAGRPLVGRGRRHRLHTGWTPLAWPSRS